MADLKGESLAAASSLANLYLYGWNNTDDLKVPASFFVPIDGSGDVDLPSGATLDWGGGNVTLDHSNKQLTVNNLETLLLSSPAGNGVSHPINQLVLRSNDLLLPDGAGGHIRFQTPNDSGTFRDGAEINAGLVDATAGAEDGLFDFSVYRAGVSEVAFTIDASLAAVFPGNTNNVYSLGRGTATWSDLYLGSGGFINWANGDIQIRHDTNVLFFEGATTGYYFDGPVRNTDPIGGIGYATGAGGAVTQATSKSTGVTLNKVSGQITLNGAALAAGTTVSFTLTDSAIAAGDVMVLNHLSGGTAGAYALNAQCAAGSATINVRNITAGSLSQAIVVAFALFKAVAA